MQLYEYSGLDIFSNYYSTVISLIFKLFEFKRQKIHPNLKLDLGQFFY